MRALIVLLAATLATTAFVRADDCEPSTSEPEVEAFGFYVDNDPCQPDCLFSIWWYQESNGIPGLQRGDEVKDDTCGGEIESDSLAFY